MDVDEGPVHHLLSADSIKMMGESVGVSNLNEDAAMRLSEALEFRFALQKLLFKTVSHVGLHQERDPHMTTFIATTVTYHPTPILVPSLLPLGIRLPHP